MRGRSAWTIVVVGGAYWVFGLVFGDLAGAATSADVRVAWRWAAWVVSAIVFGGHIVYEQVVHRGGRRVTAFCAASGAALGGFGLAVAANVHATSIGHRPAILVWSLLIWPVLIGLPAFVVALVAADLLARARRAFRH